MDGIVEMRDGTAIRIQKVGSIKVSVVLEAVKKFGVIQNFVFIPNMMSIVSVRKDWRFGLLISRKADQGMAVVVENVTRLWFTDR